MAYKFQLGDAILSGSIQASDDMFTEDKKAISVGTDKDGSMVFDSDGSIAGFAGGMVISGSAAANSLYLAGHLNGSDAIKVGVQGRDYIRVDDANQRLDLSQAVRILDSIDVDTAGGFKLQNTAVTADANELNLLEGSVAASIVNSKAVIYGSSGEVNATTLQVGGVAITSTPAELNKLAGAGGDVTAAKLTTLSGLTPTEIGYLDGAQLDNSVASKTAMLDASRKLLGLAEVSASGDMIGGHAKSRQISIGYNGSGGQEGHLKIGATGQMQLAAFGNNVNVMNNASDGDIVFQIKDDSVDKQVAKVLGADARFDVSVHNGTTEGLALGGTLVTADAGELNKLDGALVSTAELNKLAGGTSNSAANKVIICDAQGDFEMSDNDKIFFGDGGGSDSQIFWDGDSLEIVSAAINIGAGTSEVIVGDNLTVSGDLTVNGDVTTVSTTNMVVKDPLIELNNGASSNANDLGLVFERGSTGDNAIFMWDESADKFTMGTTTATGASTGNLTVAAGTLVAALEGNASTATALESAQTIGGVSFDGTAAIVPETLSLLDDESSNAARLLCFADADGTQRIKNDGDLTYNPSTGKVTAAIFAGNLEGAMVESVIATKTANYTWDKADGTILPVNPSGGAFQVTLPNASVAYKGLVLKIKKVHASTNGVTIHQGGDFATVDGGSHIVLESPYAAVSLWTDGSAWYIM